MVIIRILLVVLLTMLIVKLLVRILVPYLIRRHIINKNNPFFNDINFQQNPKKSKFDGQGEYVDYEEIKEDKKTD